MRTSVTVWLTVLLIATASPGAPPAPARAQADDTPSEPVWELTGLTEPAQELFTPASGAFLAR